MVKGWACHALEEASEVIKGSVEWLQDPLLKVSRVLLGGGRVGHRHWKRWWWFTEESHSQCSLTHAPPKMSQTSLTNIAGWLHHTDLSSEEIPRHANIRLREQMDGG
jgi:hypothetical protein